MSGVFLPIIEGLASSTQQSSGSGPTNASLLLWNETPSLDQEITLF